MMGGELVLVVFAYGVSDVADNVSVVELVPCNGLAMLPAEVAAQCFHGGEFHDSTAAGTLCVDVTWVNAAVAAFGYLGMMVCAELVEGSQPCGVCPVITV